MHLHLWETCTIVLEDIIVHVCYRETSISKAGKIWNVYLQGLYFIFYQNILLHLWNILVFAKYEFCFLSLSYLGELFILNTELHKGKKAENIKRQNPAAQIQSSTPTNAYFI